MNSLVIIIVALLLYVLLYMTYGKALQNKVARADPNKKTPAHRLYDGVDYVPAHPVVLYGHHFASIAGAGPILGPAMAMAWGWLPGLLWVWFGNAFIGAVHDYLSLMASVRYDGKSIQWISGKIMSKRTGVIFEVYIWFTLLLVLAAFMAVVGSIFSGTPQAATASLLFILSAIVVGFLMYKIKLNFYVTTVIGVILVALSYWIGLKAPLSLTYHNWLPILFVYIIIASSIPVWVLLQPRDYLNAYILWFGLAFGGIALIGLAKGFVVPSYTIFSANVVGKVPSPFWPTVPLVIACGALSGFHSLVSSGTSSKQLDNELHGLLVGYGGMFTEGFLSTLVIVSIAVYGLQAANAVAPEAGITLENWARTYINAKALTVFTKSYGYAVSDFYGISKEAGAIFASLWVSAFCLTTLDTATRLGRFAWQEIIEYIFPKGQKVLSNKWFASALIAVLALALAWNRSYNVLWPAFSGMNQLLASIAMMTAAVWVAKVQRVGNWTYAVLIPAIFLWITVTAGLIWYIIYVPGNYAVKTIIGISLILNIMLIADFYLAWRRPAEEYEKLAA